MSDWQEVPLDELKASTPNAIAMGPFGSRIKVENFVDHGVPVIKGGNLTGSFIVEDKFDYLTAEKADELKASNAFPLDIVITHRGTIGQVGIIPQNSKFGRYVVSQSQLKVSLDQENANPYFIYYFLRSPLGQHRLLENASQVGVPAIAQASTSVKKILVPNPSREDQDRVVKILLDLDHKIELNRQINRTLEEMAQAIFKSWFVDFDPVKAKMEAVANGEDPNRAAMLAISGKSDAELDALPRDQFDHIAASAALFPDALQDSDLGEIPEGWVVKTIEELSTNVAMGPFGSNIKVDTFVAEGVPIINGQQLKGTMLEDGENKFITFEHADKLSKCNVCRGDIVITHRGTLGQVSIIPEGSKYERYIVSQSQCYIRPDRRVISPLFLIYYFKSHIGQHELLAHKSQVGVPSIAKPVTNLRKIELLAPSKRISDAFDQSIGSFHKQTSQKINEICLLEQLRDALLPKLLSGEISFGAVQTEFEEAI